MWYSIYIVEKGFQLLFLYMTKTIKISINKIIFVVFLVMLIVTISHGMYVYYISQEYDYMVEAYCDPTIDVCFERDCSAPEECPPNGLSIYKKYLIRARDFAKCTDNSCTNVCAEEQGICTPTICGANPTDSCTRFEY